MNRTTRRKGRRARGTGSVFFHEGRQRWVARKVVNGVQVERWGVTQREAVEKLNAAAPPDPNTVTVEEWATLWLAGLRSRHGTRTDYTRSVDVHIVPHLGPIRLRDLTAGRVESFAAGISEGRSPNTVFKVLTHAGTMLAAAVRGGLIPTNPVSLAKKPRRVKKKIEPFTPAELRAIIGAAIDTGRHVVGLLAGCGCRLGEAAGLDVGDWNPAAGTISITKTNYLSHGQGPPKTEHGTRTIEVPSPVAPLLVAAAGDRTDGPLFLTGYGGRAHHTSVRSAVKAVLKAAGLPYRNPHQLRHSVATALISAGHPLGDVAAYLGDTVETVVKTYLHPSGANPAATLNALLGGHKVGGQQAGPSKPHKS